MTDPQPLTDNELAEWREWLDDRSVNWPSSAGNAVGRLLATVDAARAERDALHSIVRRYLAGWDLTLLSGDGGNTWAPNVWVHEDDKDDESERAPTVAEIEAMRRVLDSPSEDGQ